MILEWNDILVKNILQKIQLYKNQLKYQWTNYATQPNSYTFLVTLIVTKHFYIFNNHWKKETPSTNPTYFRI